MFQFSKTINHQLKTTPEEYFKDWINWFQTCGIKTEIVKTEKKFSLWREGTEAKTK